MYWKKLTIFFFVAAAAFSALLVPTKRAHAFFGCTPVITPATPIGPFVPAYDASTALQQSFTNLYNSSVYQKQCILDGLVKILAKSLINNLTGSIVDWINNDFQGGPAFVTDPAGFFTNIADETAGNFIETQLGPIGQLLCSPFDLRLRLDLWLATGASRKQYIGCRLTGIEQNAYRAFTQGGFIVNGGWSTFNAITSDPRNNQYGAYIYASDALNTEFIKKANEKLRELSYGRGFLSFKKCVASKAETNSTGGHDCLKYEVQTPGSVIESQLGNALGTDLRQLELADNFNAILGAVVNYGLRQVFSAGGGLLSASSQGAGGVSPSAQRLRDGDFSSLYALSNETGTTTTRQVRVAVGEISNTDSTVIAANGVKGEAGAPVSSVGNIARGKKASQADGLDCEKLGNSFVQDSAASAAVDGQRVQSSGYYGSFACTKGNYWLVDLETDGGSSQHQWMVQEITKISLYRLTGDWAAGTAGSDYNNTLRDGYFTVEILTGNNVPPVFTVQKTSADFGSSYSLTIPVPAGTKGRFVRITRADSTSYPLAIAEVEVSGSALQTTSNDVINSVGFSAPALVNAGNIDAHNIPIVAKQQAELGTVFTANAAGSDARVRVTIQKKKFGSYVNLAPGQEFSQFDVLVKNANSINPTPFAPFHESIITPENYTDPYTVSTSMISSIKNQQVSVGYTFTPTDAAALSGGVPNGGDFQIITELVDSAGKVISGGMSTIQFHVAP